MYKNYAFTAVAPPVFDLKLDNRTRERTGTKFTDPEAPGLKYYAGDSYRISPYKLLTTTTPSQGNVSDIRYTVEGAPDGWFVGAESGEIAGSFSSTGLQNISLYAVDKCSQRKLVQNYKHFVLNIAMYIRSIDFTNQKEVAACYYFIETSD